MTAFTATMQKHAHCCGNSAAACTSAHIYRILDTVILAVSIFVALLGLPL